MKVLLVHNRYSQRGGEDVVFENESAMLRAAGHEVEEFVEDNRRVSELSKLDLAFTTLWSRATYTKLSRLVERWRPDVAHFHNTLPLVSSSGYYAARRGGAAVVQTLHNYRLVCPAGVLFRDGRVCEQCVGKAVAWPGVAHACYRASRLQSLGVACAVGVHRAAGTWSNVVDAYIVLTEFAKRKLAEGGVPSDRVFVKPNALAVAPEYEPRSREGVFLFVGRLSQEKGVDLLLDAAERLDDSVRLQIVGDGPMGDALRARRVSGARVEWLGSLAPAEVADRMRCATALVVPSRWYEGLPMVIVEAFAYGLPVIAAGHGSLAELVKDGETGMLHRPADAVDLAERVAWAALHPVEMARMGETCREEFEAHYMAGRNLERLIDIYGRARGRRV